MSVGEAHPFPSSPHPLALVVHPHAVVLSVLRRCHALPRSRSSDGSRVHLERPENMPRSRSVDYYAKRDEDAALPYLPSDVVSVIASFADGATLSAMRKTDSEWRAAASLPRLWRRCLLREHNLDVTTLQPPPPPKLLARFYLSLERARRVALHEASSRASATRHHGVQLVLPRSSVGLLRRHQNG